MVMQRYITGRRYVPRSPRDFARIRITSRCYSLSVTAEVTVLSLVSVDPDRIAIAASSDRHLVSYTKRDRTGLATFDVRFLKRHPSPERELHTVAARLENAYDAAAGEDVVR